MRFLISPVTHIFTKVNIICSHGFSDKPGLLLLLQTYPLIYTLFFHSLIIFVGIYVTVGCVPVTILIRHKASFTSTKEASIILIFELWKHFNRICFGMNLVPVFATNWSIMIEWIILAFKINLRVLQVIVLYMTFSLSSVRTHRTLCLHWV